MLLNQIVALGALIATSGAIVCPQPAGENILVNGNFEASSTSLAPWIITPEAPGRPPNAGPRSPGYKSNVMFGTGPAKTHDQRFVNLSQSFRGCHNQPYILSFRYKFEDVHYPSSAVLYTPIGDLFQGIRNEPRRINDTWHLFQQYFTNGTRVDFSADLSNTTGEIFIDDVRVTPQNPVIAKPGAQELIQNGHFETGELSPWTGATTQYCSVSTPGDDSSYAFNCIFPKAGSSFPVAKIQQSLPTKPKGRYIISFDFSYSISIEGSRCSLEYGLSTLGRFTSVQRAMGNQTGPWYHYEHGVIAHYPVTKLYFQLSSYSTFGACNVSVDNISFKDAARH